MSAWLSDAREYVSGAIGPDGAAALFDDAASRPQLVNLYNAEQSLMTFEGQQMQGSRPLFIIRRCHSTNSWP